MIHQLSIEATLSELTLYDVHVEATTKGEQLRDLFDQTPDLPAVVITQAGFAVGSISRERFNRELSRPYGQEIFLPRSIEQMTWLPIREQLVLRSHETIVEGARAAMERSAKEHYEPLLVDMGNHHFRVLDIQHLLLAQSHIHQATIHLYREANNRWQKAAQGLKQAQQKLLESAHQSGKAEIATDILHNVGNALNSLNISSIVLRERLENSRLDFMEKVVELCRTDPTLVLGSEDDPRGTVLIKALEKLLHNLKRTHHQALSETENLQKHLLIISGFIRDQENYTATESMSEPVDVRALVDQVLGALNLHKGDTFIHCPIDPDYQLLLPRPKILQVLRVILRNAHEAMKGQVDREITVTMNVSDVCTVEIRDNGEGISPENLNRIFQPGFSTKVGGSGFGIHYCANVMKSLDGSIEITSDGPGKGCCVSLHLPKSLVIKKHREFSMMP